jgi:hypothetical protein
MTVSYAIINHRLTLVLRPHWRKGYRPATTKRPV